MAADSSAPPAAPAHDGSLAIEPTDAESFADRLFAEHMPRCHVPGAAFALVHRGRIVLVKGFGLANLETKTPVVADQTLFDVQSITKLFTATALMQAVEHGHVRLSDDINTHLRTFRVPPTYPEPVRLVHLVTHTSGLEDRAIGIAARRWSDVLPLGEFLARSLPPRVRPPGEAILYSDVGVCLAGHAVESAAGVPLADFMQKNILDPLEMRRSRFLALPPELAGDLATGYAFERGRYQAIPNDYEIIWPASSLMTTATDMTHFMIAHLDRGRFGDRRILREATARTMHARVFSHHPRLPGVCLGFLEYFANGQRAIRHTGGGGGFSSELLLVPDLDLGYFCAMNSADGELLGVLRGAFFDHFLKRPLRATPPPPAANAAGAAGRFTGWYWTNRYDRRTIAKLQSLLGGYLHVGANPDGSLSIDGEHYAPIEPLLFEAASNDQRLLLAFGESADGTISRLLADLEAFDRVPWHNSPPFQLGVLAGAGLVFLGCAVAWPTACIVNHLWRRPARQPARARFVRAWAAVTSAGNLVVMVAIGAILARAQLPSFAAEFQIGAPPALLATLAASTLMAVLSLTLPLLAGVAWVKHHGSVLERACYTLLAAASLGYVWFLNTWNLVGFRY